MTKLDVAAIYVGLNLLILLTLSILVVRQRLRTKVVIGDGGEMPLQRAIRAHANAAEYVPAGLAGLLMLAWLPAVPMEALHGAGAALTAGRALHALGLSATEGRSAGRGLGTLLTWLSFLAMGVGLIAAGLAPLL